MLDPSGRLCGKVGNSYVYCAERFLNISYLNKQIFLCNIIFQSNFVIGKSIIIINCKWIYTLWQCATVQDREIKYRMVQYSTVQYKTIQYNKHTSHKITYNTLHTQLQEKLRTQIIAY